MRTFSGSEQFDALKKTVVDSYSKLFPVTNQTGYKLELKKIWVDDSDLDLHDYTAQKKTRLQRQTWGAPVYASLELKDPSGKTVDHLDKIRFSTIPRLTPRGSYIVGGNEYQIANQLRRKPGVYVVKRATGDQWKANFNTSGESAKNFELHFDPTSNRYLVKKIAGGQGSIPLYPLLHAIGVTDKELTNAWGPEILAANHRHSPADVFKYAKQFAGVTTDNQATASEALKEWAKKVHLDPHTTEITLGKPHPTLSPSTLIDTSKKLLHVYQGTAQADDPESLLFKEVLSVEDMLHDRLNSKKQTSAMQYMLSRHLGKRMKIEDLIDRRKLTSPVESFFTHDDRVSTPEQYNPMQMLSNMHKLTLMGTGGIKDPNTVTPEIREVHPSHVGFVDPVHTPESQRIGTMLHLTAGVRKDGREIRTEVYNVKTGKMELLTPRELYTKAVAFPDEVSFGKDGKVTFKTKDVRAQQLGKMQTMAPSKVEYVIPTHTQLFSYSTNMIPFLHNDQGTRTMMGSKMMEQAIPLVDREAPLVQTDVGNGETFHKLVGDQVSVHSPADGKITNITPDHIEIDKKHKIPLYNYFPLNQKTFIHHEPKVKLGDSVKKGQLLADTNFTKDGVLSLGKNLKVAYLPYPGLTFEDGIVITDSASKKLATEQMYKHSFDLEAKRRESNLKRFVAYYPAVVPARTLNEYDQDGVIKKGSVVQPGQVVIMGMHYNLSSPENSTLKRINKALQIPWANASVKYGGEFPGIVSDVVKRADRIDVYVRATEPARESDKLSGVHGNKGVITRVVPDADAPHLADGTVPDVFLNPHGIIGRINLGQLFESAASKIAKKTGKPYVVKNFNGEDSSVKIQSELDKHGLSDLEDMYLPNGKRLGKVNVGNPYILRLAKTGKSGFSARMPGVGYDLNMQPTRGGEAGTKNLDLMTFYSMLSHGAKKNLLDAHQKSEKNDEFWHAVETGKTLPAPKTTFVFNKLVSLLRGAGVNPDKQGADIVLGPMTDKEVLKLSHGKITDPEFLYGKDLKEKKGGFFDKAITGGMFGNNYAHLELHEAMPNPIFEKAIRNLTGLTDDSYRGVLNGSKHVTAKGELVDHATPGSVTAGAGIHRLLSKIDVEVETEKLHKQLKTAKKDSDIDKINKKLRYLGALKELSLQPEEAYMRKLIPVIPPIHRPIYEMPNRGLQVAPANTLYQSVGILNDMQNKPVMKLLGDEDKKELREDLYKSTRALAGLEPVIQKSREQVPLKGFISQISGESPKTGFFLQKVISKRQDLVGRGVITAAPDLDVDQLGIPEKMAWKIFRPFAIREYTMSGIPAVVARQELDQQVPRAKKMLQNAMNRRTVLMNRAPSLHKFSIMAFKPVLSEGLAVRVPPLVLKGFGGDFDGDAVTLHVPVSEQAVMESHNMLPSRNLFKPGTGELMIAPSQESTIGLYFLSQTAEGRKKINTLLPAKFHISEVLDAKNGKKLFDRIAKEAPKEFSKIVMDLKTLGDTTAYERGFSVGLKDIVAPRHIRERIFDEADKKVGDLKKHHKQSPDLDQKVAALYQDAAEKSYHQIKGELKKTDNNFYHMVTSGARGKDQQLMQLVSAPGIMNDAKDRPVPTPIRKSYAEGLSTSDYFVAAYGVRKGMMDRALQTSAPGALNKDIMASTIDNIVSKEDCGTHRGLVFPISSSDVLERYLAKDQSGFNRDTLVTPQVVSALQKKGVREIEVRSPLTCIAPRGTCAMCFGLDEHGHLPQIGDNVGAKSGQTMSEPLTQMTMKTFHTGGVAGGASVAKGFERVQQLLRMPEYVAGEAELAKETGKVTHIKKTPVGGHEIHVGDEVHTVRPGLPLRVKMGDHVNAGDALSEGVIKPQNLVKYKGMPKAQEYIVDELKQAYSGQGIPMHRKVFETVVRSIGNLTRVVRAPKHADFLPGDVIPYTTAVHYNETRGETMPVADAKGYHLKHPIGNLPGLHEIGDKDISYIRGLGYNKIDVLKDPMVHAPILKGVERLPMEKRNWMAQIGYRYIKDTLTEGAAQAWKTNVEGAHPIPAFAYGANFGKKKEHY